MSDSASMAAATEARFSNRDLIGRGSFGDVYRGFDKELSKEVAIKVIDLEEAEDDIEDIQKEISVLSQCRCPYITDYYGSYLHQTKLWIVMEYMAGGSVADLLQAGPPLDEISIACILRDLLHAVEYLHSEGKIHRDIKAANILLTESGDVKVADFGVSAQLTKTMSRRKRPSAKELLKNRFIKNARKTPKLLERIRERPKFTVKGSIDATQNGQTHIEEDDYGSTIKVDRNTRHAASPSSQGTARKAAGWDFPDRSEGTGTVRGGLRPPQITSTKDGRFDMPQNPSTLKRTADRENQWRTSGTGSEESSSTNMSKKEAQTDHGRLESSTEYNDQSVSGSGTVVLRSPRASQVYPAGPNHSSKPPSRFSSYEDMSISGTVVRNQTEEAETPRSSRSRLGTLEKTSNASLEDSATNLAEAKAALQAGFRKGNARERPATNKHEKESHEPRFSGVNSHEVRSENIDSQKGRKSRQPSDGQSAPRASAASPALSSLIIPSLKEASGDKYEGPVVHAVLSSLMDLEQEIPGSCEVLVGRILHRLGSSKDSSLQSLNETAISIFTKKPEPPSEAGSNKKQASTPPLAAPTVSPLARFLLTRWQNQVSQDLNSV
ncbi:hypothetical protein ACQJBY_009338 [Aegilops geniculata]